MMRSVNVNSDDEDTGRHDSEHKLRNKTWSKYLEEESEMVQHRYDEVMETIESVMNKAEYGIRDFDRAFEKAQDELFADDTSLTSFTGSPRDSVLGGLSTNTDTPGKLYNLANENIEKAGFNTELAYDWDDERKKAKKLLGIGLKEVPGEGVKRKNSKRASGLERTFKSISNGVKKMLKTTSEN